MKRRYSWPLLTCALLAALVAAGSWVWAAGAADKPAAGRSGVTTPALSPQPQMTISGGPELDPDSRVLGFQALLTDGAGAPLAGPHTLDFNIYDVAAGGVSMFADSDVGVVFTNGVGTTLVGDSPGLPIPPSVFEPATARYLGVAVDGGAELAPRILLSANSYTFRADSVQNAELTDDVDLGSAAADGTLDIFRNGAAAFFTQQPAEGLQFDMVNTGTGGTVYQYGTSFAGDGSGFQILHERAGTETVFLHADRDLANNGVAEGEVTVGSIGAGNTGGKIQVVNGNAKFGPGPSVLLDAGSSGDFQGGIVSVFEDTETTAVAVTTSFTGGFTSYNNNSGTLINELGVAGAGNGFINIRNTDGTSTCVIVGGATGGGSEVRGLQISGSNGILLRSEEFAAGNNGSVIEMFAEDGAEVCEMDSGFASNSGVFMFWDGTIQAVTKNAIVDMASGERRLMTCVESPEVWFEDMGSGQLNNGVAEITLEPLFLQTVTVSQEQPMRVLVTLTGDCKGVYVQKGTDRFTVRELMGGTSNATFDYKVVAKRKGYETVRLERFTRLGHGDGGVAEDPPTPGIDAGAEPVDAGVKPTMRRDARPAPQPVGDPSGGVASAPQQQ